MTTATELPAPEPASTPASAPAEAPITMLNPDFPFSYDHYLAHPDGLGAVPPELYGTEVAVVGAGLSGLVTAYELMKLGLRPVVYEADRIGGRLRTASFPSAPDVVADLGGMRFPVSGKAFYHYVDLLGLQTQEFPNPLAPATSSTVIELAGQKYYAETTADLPPFFLEVADAWKAAVNDGARFAEMQDGHPGPGHRPDQGTVERAAPGAGRADLLRLHRRQRFLQGGRLRPPRGVRPGGVRHRRLGHRLPQLHPRNPSGRLHRRR